MKPLKIRLLLVCALIVVALLAVVVSLWITAAPPDRKHGGSITGMAGETSTAPDFSEPAGVPPAAVSTNGLTPGSSAAAASSNQGPASAGPAPPSNSTWDKSTSPSPSSPQASSRRGSPRGSSKSAYTSQQQASAMVTSLPLEPPPLPVAELLQGVDLSDELQRQRVVAQMEKLGQARREVLWAKARALGVPIRQTTPGGGVSELFAFRGDEPVYRTTLNVNAAISSAASFIRQVAPYNLSGVGLRVGVWDGGSVRATHREFGARVTKQDPGAPDDDHGTHVAGTVAAAGVDSRALGMAPALNIDSYDWNDDTTEMTAAGAAAASDTARLPISNHSYGLGSTTADQGRYEVNASSLDSLAHALPYYLPFWSAGNNQARFVHSGYQRGYQTISFDKLAKNIVAVGAVNDAVSGGRREPASATMSTFSSWGPCDDGRIKPDLVANGVSVFSPVASSDTAYDGNYSGTSMASPSAAGSAALLVEFYQRKFGGRLPRASLLKALLIHTADDLGNAGPDYKFGWGLINVQAAADLLVKHEAEPLYPRIYEGTLSNAAKTQSYSFTWDGVTPLKATLCWTDPAGAAQTAIDSRTPNLVHNLDLRIIAPDGTTVFEPFVMPFVGTWTGAAAALPATKGDNNVDNVEQVLAGLTGQIGTYTMTVTVDGSLTTATQDYSIVLSGVGQPVNPPPVVNIVTPQDGARLPPDAPATIIVEATDLTRDQKPGVIASIDLFVNGTLFARRVSSPAEFEFLPPAVGTYVFTALATDSEGASGTDTATVSFAYPPAGSVREDFSPPQADGHVQALAADPQGRIYVGGLFTQLGDSSASRVGRLRPDGSVDPTFFVGTGPDAQVRALLHVAQDQGLYVGGHFTNFSGSPRRALVRLRTGQAGFVDGSVDPTFAPVIEALNSSAVPYVRAIARQSDGKIIIGGFFSRINGFNCANLARLNPDGTIDSTFAPVPNGTVHAIALQPDGKILIGGAFAQVGGINSRRIARLLPNGSLDGSFVTGTDVSGGFDGPVNAIAVTLDGEVIAGGAFTAYNGRSFHSNLAKLLPNGAIDAQFNFTPGLNGVVNDLHLRPTGEILVSGLFTEVGNNAVGLVATPVGRVFQIKSGGADNGTLDADFNPGGAGADGAVIDSITLPSGDILLAGAFATFNGEPRARLAVVAGFERPRHVITSQLFHNLDAGAELDFSFTSSGTGPHFYQLTGPLPRGLTFDEATGTLRGLPLDAGRYDLQIVATSADGASESTRFVLNVNDQKVSYAQWQRAWFSAAERMDPGVSGPRAILNSSGLNNLMVYAFGGGNPATADKSLWPEVRREKIGPRHYLTLTVPKYPGAAVTYQPEFSADLSSWAWAVPDHVVILSETPQELRVRAAHSVTESTQQFLRLKITAP